MSRCLSICLCLILACAGLFAGPRADTPPAGRPEDERTFEIPAGEAVSTLSLFARQSSLPLVYLVEDVRGERTQPVRGVFNSMKALETMLRGSHLIVSYDPEGHALMVRRQKEPPPADPGAD